MKKKQAHKVLALKTLTVQSAEKSDFINEKSAALK